MPPKTLARTALPAWVPFTAPFVLFLVMTSVEGQNLSLYPWLYTLKIALVGALLLALRPALADARWQARGQGLAVLAGVILVFAWVWVDRYTPHLKMLGGRVAYNPFERLHSPALRDAFLGVRFFGLVVIVPIIEETFYRGFLLRYVTDPDQWQRVPLGRFSLAALAITTALFAVSHPEWLAALVFGAAMCALLARTKNLSACITAHAVTNLLLGLYVIHFHQWQYW